MAELTREQRRPDTIGGSLERRVIEVTWLDGHRSAYDFEYLRWNCPCAICRGEGGQPGVLASTTALTPDQTTLVDVGPVGNYALGITWQDGHAAGIYAFEYLRRLCPCAECRGAPATPPEP